MYQPRHQHSPGPGWVPLRLAQYHHTLQYIHSSRGILLRTRRGSALTVSGARILRSGGVGWLPRCAHIWCAHTSAHICGGSVSADVRSAIWYGAHLGRCKCTLYSPQEKRSTVCRIFCMYIRLCFRFAPVRFLNNDLIVSIRAEMCLNVPLGRQYHMYGGQFRTSSGPHHWLRHSMYQTFVWWQPLGTMTQEQDCMYADPKLHHIKSPSLVAFGSGYGPSQYHTLRDSSLSWWDSIC